MQQYCAFLRGVNVNGTRMLMKDVCEVFTNCGLKNVSSVLASGNILFSADDTPENLLLDLKAALSKKYKYEAHLWIKSDIEIKNILAANPFAEEENFHTYIFIAKPEITQVLLERFINSNKKEGEEGALVDQQFYWKVKKGETLHTEFGKILGNKSFKSGLTSRNLNTFEKILQK